MPVLNGIDAVSQSRNRRRNLMATSERAGAPKLQSAENWRAGMKRDWLRNAFCTLFLMVVLWDLAHHTFNLNSGRWRQIPFAVNLGGGNEKLLRFS